jgi:hypothetical protein
MTNQSGSGWYYKETEEIDQKEGLVSLALNSEALAYFSSKAFVAGRLAVDYLYYDGRTKSTDKEEYVTNRGEEAVDSIEIEGTIGDRRNVTKNMTLSGELSVGYGKSYEGRFAATALLMTGELSMRDLLEKQPNHRQMQVLSDMIRKYQSSHALDSREHRSAALTAITKFLTDHDIVDSDNEAVALVLGDAWDFYPRLSRRFGSAVALGFGGDDYYESIHDGTNSVAIEKLTQIIRDSLGVRLLVTDRSYEAVHSTNESSLMARDFIAIHCDAFRPLSVRWQLDVSGLVRFYLSKPLISKEQGDTRVDTYYRRDVSLGAALRYIYDARTDLAISASASGVWWKQTQSTHLPDWHGGYIWHQEGWEMRELLMDCLVQLSYRISVPTTLTLGLLYDFKTTDYWGANRSEKVVYDSHGFDLSAGITHWLF